MAAPIPAPIIPGPAPADVLYHNRFTFLAYKFECFRTTSYLPNYNGQGFYNFRVPKPGLYMGPVRRPHAPNLPPYPARNSNGQVEANPVPVTVPAGRRRLCDQLRPRQMHYQKTLGFGGNGLAALFHYTPEGSSRRRYVVAKFNHAGNQRAEQALRVETNVTNVSTC